MKLWNLFKTKQPRGNLITLELDPITTAYYYDGETTNVKALSGVIAYSGKPPVIYMLSTDERLRRIEEKLFPQETTNQTSESQ